MYVANVGIRERMERAPGWRLNDPPSLSFLNIYLRTNGEKREERRSANVSILSLAHRCYALAKKYVRASRQRTITPHNFWEGVNCATHKKKLLKKKSSQEIIENYTSEQ